MGGKSFKDILWKIFRFVFLGFMALISVGPLRAFQVLCKQKKLI